MGELRFLHGLGLWGVFFFVLIALCLRLFWGINKDEGSGRWVAWLRHDRFARRYREMLDAGLNRLDRFLSPEFPNDPTNHDTNSKTEPGRAWSWRLLDWLLFFAVTYPILALLLDWTLTGDAGRIGALEILYAEPTWWRRWLPVCLMMLAFVAATLALRTDSNLARAMFQVAGGGLAIAAIVVGAGAGAIAFAAALAVAIAAGLAISSAAVGAGAVVGTIVFGFSGAATGAFVVVVAVVGACAGIIAHNWVGSRIGLRRTTLFAFSLLLFATLTVVVLRFDGAADQEVQAFVVLLDFLPLLNSWAGFASAGLTRWRLRCGAQSHLVFNSVVDAFAAIVILFLLAFAIIATIHIVRLGGGAPLFDLTALFADLRAAPGRYWWLGFMLFLTLLPTLINLAKGAFALFTLVSGWLGKPIAAVLMKGDSTEGRFASLALTLCAALAVWAPIFVLWHGLARGGG